MTKAKVGVAPVPSVADLLAKRLERTRRSVQETMRANDLDQFRGVVTAMAEAGDVTAVEHPAADRAASYGLERVIIDGNDADAVYRTARSAYQKARAGGGPSLIECITYRHSGHSRADPAKYRPEGELDKWKERDPIRLYRQRLEQFGVDGDVIEQIEADARRRVDEATEKCKAAPPPPLDLLTTDVYADGGFAWRN